MVNNLAQGVTASELQDELNKNGYPDATVRGTTLLEVTFDSGNIYNVKNNGEISIKTESDDEIVDFLSKGVAITKDGRVVFINEKTSETEKNVWNEVEIGQEIEEINGVLKSVSSWDAYYIINNSGNLYAWGYNYDGQLGIEGYDSNILSPQCINSLDGQPLYGKNIVLFKTLEALSEEDDYIHYVITNGGEIYSYKYYVEAN